ncbi:uncharacterized protein LOC117170155 isoform X2 [Belonocnema kinseyi]|uniref:uncharacterized protein LOC117170155 isoform X2 n=1 Tax=Belonocnema kinseyi TaxID=2817044 RepID=UPI00143DDF0F|nr:uncharacterized protein LOC117170155 isoform X2 [Belonocnema kinseyi]
MFLHTSEHEYEPIAHPPPPPLIVNIGAPVVRITDTDVMPVADSDDSVDDQGRFYSGLTLHSDLILPLDGQLEDSAMEGRELGETIDTSDEQESTQQLQDRLEEHFFTAPCPGLESSTDGENNTNQVTSSVQKELPGRQSIHGFQAKLRSQAGKLRSQFRGIQKPTVTMPAYRRSEKKKSASTTANEKVKLEKPKSEKSKNEKASKMERFKMALPERPRFSFPDTSKLGLPSRPKFNLKRPNINFPSAFDRSQTGTASSREQTRQPSKHSTYGSGKNIFDFSTYPRLFDRKAKNKAEYATSSPKVSRAQSAESATFPRTKKSLRARWTQRFADTKPLNNKQEEQNVAVERSRPWRHPSFEEPRLAFKIQASESLKESEKLPWETFEQKTVDHQEEIQYADYEEDSQEHSDQRVLGSNDRTKVEEPFEQRLYSDRTVDREIKHPERFNKSEDEVEMEEVEVLKFKRVESFENASQDDYESCFHPVDPRKFRKISSEERSSVRSDGEQQQSSGSSFERRRCGVIEKIDSDELFLREKGISQDDMSVGRYIASEIYDALKATPGNALTDIDIIPMPPLRPNRTRYFRNRKENFSESYNDLPPARLEREKNLCRSEESFSNLDQTGSSSSAVHRVVYRADSLSRERSPAEPLDNIIIVKPARRKSRSSLHSHSQVTTKSSVKIEPRISSEIIPPAVPNRRKRILRQVENEIKQIQNGNVQHQKREIQFACNGHGEWNKFENSLRQEHPRTPSPTLQVAPASVDHKIMNNLFMRLKQEFAERSPVPPKRSSRSRTASFIQDEDRTSHGAESLPEIGYIEDDINKDYSREQLPGYAVIEKREKPPRPSPPRRHRHKFATTPRPMAPKRPQRAYSTLRPVGRISPAVTQIIRSSEDVRQYIEDDSDGEHKDLRSGEVLSRMQGRPLPAPPRPPRLHRTVKNSAGYYEPEAVHSMTDVVASTQTDPLPEDHVIEEEITQAKLIMAPSRSGSQVLISTERISTPTRSHAPPIPHPPIMQHSEDRRVSEERRGSNRVEEEWIEDRPVPSNRVEDEIQQDLADILRAALHSDEPLRINSLEVGDLRVDRFSVSQLQAYNITASEIDAIVVSASEMTGKASIADSGISPALLQELIAIKRHLVNKSLIQEEPPSRIESATMNTMTTMASSDEKIEDILQAVRTQDSIRRSSTRDVGSLLGNESGRLDVEKLDSVKKKAKRVTESRMQPSSESETLRGQVLKGDKLKSGAEVKSEIGSNSLPSKSTSRESSIDKHERLYERSRSRSKSSSPSSGFQPVRQTASTIKSLPPVISVTPDTMDTPVCHTISSESRPQRAIMSYCEKKTEKSHEEITQTSQDTLLRDFTQCITLQTSQIPDKFFSPASPTTQKVETEPNITETTQQLLKALRIIGIRKMRQFVNYIASRVGREESSDKIKDVELILCALLLIVAGLIIMIFATPCTVAHHHHWDYFNPPQ